MNLTYTVSMRAVNVVSPFFVVCFFVIACCKQQKLDKIRA